MIDKIEEHLKINEKYFITGDLKKSIKYLVNNRNGDAWGFDKNSSTDIHFSALSIEAIRSSKDPEFLTILADSQIYLKGIIRDNLNSYDEEQLADSLYILSGVSPKALELNEKLISRLIELNQEKGWGKPRPSLVLSCKVVILSITISERFKEIAEKYVKYLIRSQNQEDGGWGSTQESKSTIIPTCYALRVLNRFPDTTTNSAKMKGINFIAKSLKEVGFESMDNTFEVSEVLRAIAELKEFQYEFVKQGIDSLELRINSDGGWGFKKGLQSDIENTALSIIALVAAGQTRFISSNLVAGIVNELNTQITNLQNELKTYKVDLEGLVRQESKNVIIENESLVKLRRRTPQQRLRGMQGATARLVEIQ